MAEEEPKVSTSQGSFHTGAMSFDWIPYRARLHDLATRYARGDRWAPVPAELDRAIASDAALAEAARVVRAATYPKLRRLPVAVAPSLWERFDLAYGRVPRERFVMPEDIALSVEDEPLPLDRHGRATVSAPHAYLLTFALLELGEGDHLLELGTGTGYGAALARVIVGSTGAVTSVEVDRELHERARRLLQAPPLPDEAPVTLVFGDGRDVAPGLLAHDAARSRPPNKVAITYAIRADPMPLVAALPLHGWLVAPVGPTEELQELVRYRRTEDGIARTMHGGVRYVTERH
jgi:protein-L-isoaspartate(D-aspartate) O-methyltransferase